MRRINDELPLDINILDIQKVRHTFHARHSARARTYIYQVARRRTAFAKPFVWWVDDLDLSRMRQVAERLGFHDFRSFSDDDPERKSTTVRLNALEIHELGALIRPCRRIALYLEDGPPACRAQEVGRGLTPDEAVAMLSTNSELPARLTAPASGLFLEQVRYDADPTPGRSISPAPCGSWELISGVELFYGRLLAGGVMP